MDTTQLKRRDLIDVCRLAGCNMQELETDPTAQLALAWKVEQRAGDTDLEFEDWLDEDLEVEVTEEPEDPS